MKTANELFQDIVIFDFNNLSKDQVDTFIERIIEGQITNQLNMSKTIFHINGNDILTHWNESNPDRLIIQRKFSDFHKPSRSLPYEDISYKEQNPVNDFLTAARNMLDTNGYWTFGSGAHLYAEIPQFVASEEPQFHKLRTILRDNQLADHTKIISSHDSVHTIEIEGKSPFFSFRLERYRNLFGSFIDDSNAFHFLHGFPEFRNLEKPETK